MVNIKSNPEVSQSTANASLASADRNSAMQEQKSGAFGWLRSLGDAANRTIDAAGSYVGGEGLIGKAIDKVGDVTKGALGGAAGLGDGAVNVAAAAVDKVESAAAATSQFVVDGAKATVSAGKYVAKETAELAVDGAKATISAGKYVAKETAELAVDGAKATISAGKYVAKETAEFAVEGAKATVWAAGQLKEAVDKFPEVATNFAGGKIRDLGNNVSGLISEVAIGLGGDGLIGKGGVAYSKGVKAAFDTWAGAIEKTDDVARFVKELPGDLAAGTLKKIGEADAFLIRSLDELQKKACGAAGFSANVLANGIDATAATHAGMMRGIGSFLGGGGLIGELYEKGAQNNTNAASALSSLLRGLHANVEKISHGVSNGSQATASFVEDKTGVAADKIDQLL